MEITKPLFLPPQALFRATHIIASLSTFHSCCAPNPNHPVLISTLYALSFTLNGWPQLFKLVYLHDHLSPSFSLSLALTVIPFLQHVAPLLCPYHPTLCLWMWSTIWCPQTQRWSWTNTMILRNNTNMGNHQHTKSVWINNYFKYLNTVNTFSHRQDELLKVKLSITKGKKGD